MRKPAILLAAAVLAASALSAAAQTSAWSSMSANGQFNNWKNPPKPNMHLVSNNTWQGDFFLPTTNRTWFKFAANESWSYDWGESNQGDFTLPISGTAEYQPGNGKDIYISNVTYGVHRFTFNAATREYTIEKVNSLMASNAQITLVGDYPGWSPVPLPNMTLISNHVWQTTYFLPAVENPKFKFLANGDYHPTHWGETSQPDTVPPITDTADVIAGNVTGYDIWMSGTYRNWFIFRFNDSTRVYSILPLYSSTYKSMAVGGTFNEWDPAPNMELITDYVWEATFSFVDQGSVALKFVAEKNWNYQWGETDQDLLDDPLQGTAESTTGGGNDIILQGPLNGTYHFRFRENDRYYEVFSAGYWQKFDDWTGAGSSYVCQESNGWVICTAMIRDDDYARYGKAVRLGNTAPVLPSGHYLRTPFLSNGVGRISFWYCNWDGDPPVTYDVQVSSNDTDWTTIGGITDAANVVYARYEQQIDATNAVYIRLHHTNGAERFLVDDFMISEPFANVQFVDLWTAPSHPWIGDAVTVNALIMTNRYAADLTATAYYRIGSNGTWNTLSMTGTTNFFTTAGSIPPQPSGTKVYYYVRADFEGTGFNSPRFSPADGASAPAWYAIPRNKHGNAWVNEVSYNPQFFEENTNEFVELAGLSGLDIGHWTLSLYDLYVSYADYRFPNNTILPWDTNGFGFYVVGDTNLLNVNVVFTNAIAGDNNLAKKGYIVLRNEMGLTEYVLGYGDQAPTNLSADIYIGFDYDLWFDDYSLGLQGTGSNYYDFTWDTNDWITPGTVNEGQELVNGTPGANPTLDEVLIFDWTLGNDVLLYATGTNGWLVQPYYTTNLAENPPEWTAITPFYSIYDDGVQTIWFDRPTNSPAIYRVISTPSW
ncbi:MAG: hypothetical protein JXB04_04330 [Kiritimatiellae bacterium]|nr:hypothetical protein [Kiritimatiellia bacterium]